MKNYLYQVLIYLALTGIGFGFSKFFPGKINFNDITLVTTGAFFISVAISIIFFRGIKKPEKKGVLHTLSAVGLKFLLFLALLGIFALLKKEITVHFLAAYFVSYLAFSFYLLITFVGVLKRKNQHAPDVKGN